jgi:GAF domain-containing protein
VAPPSGAQNIDMAAPRPSNEKRRLEVLWQHDLLDTPPEQELDDLTELASFVCGTPIALISLMDEHRQWFKARIGMTQAETARDVSFCAHAIMRQDVMIVPDALQDERFARNPLVTSEPYIRFYAGVPLITAEGCALGTLCVIDHQPRQLSDRQVKALRLLARVVLRLIELRKQVRDLARIPIRQKPSPAGQEASPEEVV